jgi:hypothetical protein
VLHPVGPLPAAVYWRRRVLVLALLLSVLGGGGWLGYALVTGRGWPSTAPAAATSAAPIRTPALEQVLPSLASVQLPTVALTPARTTARAGRAPAPRPAAPVACTDDHIGLEVRTPGRVAVGAKPTFELRVANTSRTPCGRPLDKQLQELVILDAAGRRVWGSNDCFPEVSRDSRTLASGEVVTLPIVWSGLTSEPTCTAARVAPAPGAYVVRGRLDTKKTPDARLVVE